MNERIINQFNDHKTNLNGEKLQVLVLPSEEFSEGISLFNVRRIIIGDLSVKREVPSWSLLKQRIGRALRFCGHKHLPEDKRKLRIDLFISHILKDDEEGRSVLLDAVPEFHNKENNIEAVLNCKTLDEMKLDIIKQQYEEFEEGAAKFIQRHSIDHGMYY